MTAPAPPRSGFDVLDALIADALMELRAARIIGQRVKLNPIWLMFSLFAFGYLFGFIGLLIAIPLAASLGVIVRFAMRELLDGPDETTPAASSTARLAARA